MYYMLPCIREVLILKAVRSQRVLTAPNGQVYIWKEKRSGSFKASPFLWVVSMNRYVLKRPAACSCRVGG